MMHRNLHKLGLIAKSFSAPFSSSASAYCHFDKIHKFLKMAESPVSRCVDEPMLHGPSGGRVHVLGISHVGPSVGKQIVEAADILRPTHLALESSPDRITEVEIVASILRNHGLDHPSPDPQKVRELSTAFRKRMPSENSSASDGLAYMAIPGLIKNEDAIVTMKLSRERSLPLWLIDHRAANLRPYRSIWAAPLTDDRELMYYTMFLHVGNEANKQLEVPFDNSIIRQMAGDLASIGPHVPDKYANIDMERDSAMAGFLSFGCTDAPGPPPVVLAVVGASHFEKLQQVWDRAPSVLETAKLCDVTGGSREKIVDLLRAYMYFTMN
jgi:hypothetical protein